jgi:hypothetical protein
MPFECLIAPVSVAAQSSSFLSQASFSLKSPPLGVIHRRTASSLSA